MPNPKIYRYHKTFFVCVLIILVFTAFLPSLKNNFVNFDDSAYVTHNQAIKSLSWETIRTIFTSFYVNNYQPLSMLSYSLEYYFYDSHPSWYHLTNIILHLLNSLLVLWLIFIISDNLIVSFITAVLFGIHPLRVESVVWISERKDVLYAFFFLGASIAYSYYVKKDRASKYYYFSLALFFLALLSKAMAVTLPLLLLLLDYLLCRKWHRKILIEKIPFFLLSFIFGTLCIFSQQLDKNAYRLPSDSVNFIFAGSNIAFYLNKIFRPVHLCAISYFRDNAILPFYIMLILLFVFLKKGLRKIVFGIVLFLIVILPVMPIKITADRYTYVASIGIFYIIGEAFVWMYRNPLYYARVVRAILLSALIVTIGSLMLLTWKRCEIWKDGVSLWSDVLHSYPIFSKAYRNRGVAYADIGENDEAIADFTKAMRLEPNFPFDYISRGHVYLNEGKVPEAIKDFTTAIQLEPNIAYHYNDRGDAYRKMCNFDQAIKDYNKAMELEPDNILAYFGRGCAYDGKGDLLKAIYYYTKAIEINPRNAIEAYNNRGSIYYNHGNFDLAIHDYNKIIEINPNFARAYNDRAAAYFQKKEYDKSWRDVRKVEELGYDPDPVLLKNLKALKQ